MSILDRITITAVGLGFLAIPVAGLYMAGILLAAGG